MGQDEWKQNREGSGKLEEVEENDLPAANESNAGAEGKAVDGVPYMEQFFGPEADERPQPQDMLPAVANEIAAAGAIDAETPVEAEHAADQDRAADDTEEESGMDADDTDEEPGMDADELNQVIEEICRSKAAEFRMLGYEQVTGREIWECVSDKYGKSGIPPIHRIVNDILSLKVTQFMNWMTMSIYKDAHFR
ncbi:post-transcriptional regulator [Paenibacillus allorhizosphaerae]|uniref:Post-transcriptional regulator n=1 Tax=Paenibacillus allorhizosphaerae TaxID=2849866 RepID=A0ABM8VRE7_9BACL|nr:post-transcriptional regulator [Paenibacillus allorhizosphaerae]CAG7655220.1 hypothetical protein PAECIP111802_06046 [Paenibacillus allorhizosphaerae]